MEKIRYIKNSIYVLAVIISILFIWKIYDVIIPAAEKSNNVLVDEVIGNVFNQEGITDSNCRISGFYFYGTDYLSDDSKKQLVYDIANKLGITSDCDYSYEKNDTGFVASLSKSGASSQVLIQLITYEIQEGENVMSLRHYINVDMNINKSISSGLYYKEQLSKILNDLTSESLKNSNVESFREDKTISISVTGTVLGKLSVDGQKKISDNILKGLNASLVFDNTNLDVYSLYGYSEGIEEYMAIGNNKINVNIVYSYDEEKNITTIHIASPIANYDY